MIVGTPLADFWVPGFKDPMTEMPTPPSDHIPLGGVVRFEGWIHRNLYPPE